MGVGFVRCLSVSLSWNFELAVALIKQRGGVFRLWAEGLQH